MVFSREQQLASFERLLNIMDELREKCPWDKKQTFESLRSLTIEEVYELSDAILDKNSLALKNELGDILLHVVFYAKIGREERGFDIKGVIDAICDKLIFRHPHVFGDAVVLSEQQVKENWEKLKLKEGNTSVLGGVPKSLPSLIKASRIQDKAKAVGFDWENSSQVWEKIQEELQELKAEVDKKSEKHLVSNELGDVLFSVINYARFIGVDPDEALERTNKKFIKRFQYIEQKAVELGKEIHDLTLDEMNDFWQNAKNQQD
jgi:XTP/dITP diphosphohydrolase